MMAELYDVSVSAINQHLKRIYDDGELTQEATIKKYLIVHSSDFDKYLMELEKELKSDKKLYEF